MNRVRRLINAMRKPLHSSQILVKSIVAGDKAGDELYFS